MCARKGCNDSGDRAPKLVFVLDTPTRGRWRVPAIMGILFCARCAKEVTVDKLLGDDRVEQALLAMHEDAQLVETRLEWVSTSDPDYKRLQAMRGN